MLQLPDGGWLAMRIWRERECPPLRFPGCAGGGEFRWHNVYRRPGGKLEQKVATVQMIAVQLAETLFLGDDLLAWLVLAFGAALVVANVAAVVRPPRTDPDDPRSPRREPAPLGRVAPLVVLGLALAVWGLATLLAG